LFEEKKRLRESEESQRIDEEEISKDMKEMMDTEKIESIISFQDRRFGDVITWDQHKVKEWIRSSASISNLEPLISPLNLSGYFLAVSNEKELKERLLPRLNRVSQFDDFYSALSLIRTFDLQQEDIGSFRLRRFLKDFVARESCEAFLRRIHNQSGFEEFEEVIKDLKTRILSTSIKTNPFKLSRDQLLALAAFSSDVFVLSSLSETIACHLSRILKAHNGVDPVQNEDEDSDVLMDKETVIEAWKGFAFHLVKAIENLPPLRGKVFRFIECESAEEIEQMIGNRGSRIHIQDLGICCGSKSERNALQIALEAQDSCCGVLFEIDQISGRGFSSYSLNPDQADVLIAPSACLEFGLRTTVNIDKIDSLSSSSSSSSSSSPSSLRSQEGRRVVKVEVREIV